MSGSLVLGIETSCDETGAALYAPGAGILCERLASQAELHARFGGVVPELASRDHIAKLAPMVEDLLAGAGAELADLGLVAYTAGPGLIGALMVGASFAASLAYGLGLPTVPVHHMEGHLLAAMLEDPTLEFPFLALLVSGGHTELVFASGVGRYRILGQTLDDAAGEAFDKVARLLSLPYPGGPALARLAEGGQPGRFAFPRPLMHRGLDFSFSGLKTAVRIALEAETSGAPPGPALAADVAASFQAAVVETLAEKCMRALATTRCGRLVVAGGVGANARLREVLAERCEAAGARLGFPRAALCTDNGAMIAYAGWCRRSDASALPQILARPRWGLAELEAPADRTG